MGWTLRFIAKRCLLKHVLNIKLDKVLVMMKRQGVKKNIKRKESCKKGNKTKCTLFHYIFLC